MTDKTQEMTKNDVITALHEIYACLNSLLPSFDSSQMNNVTIRGHWTIKEILAHLASWETLEAGWIHDVANGRDPLLYTKGFEWDRVDREQQIRLIHSYNAHILEKVRQQTVEEAMSALSTSQSKMLRALDELPDQAFVNPEILFWIQLEVPRDPWTPMPVNSTEHYRDHAEWIRTWLDEHGQKTQR